MSDKEQLAPTDGALIEIYNEVFEVFDTNTLGVRSDMLFHFLRFMYNRSEPQYAGEMFGLKMKEYWRTIFGKYGGGWPKIMQIHHVKRLGYPTDGIFLYHSGYDKPIRFCNLVGMQARIHIISDRYELCDIQLLHKENPIEMVDICLNQKGISDTYASVIDVGTSNQELAERMLAERFNLNSASPKKIEHSGDVTTFYFRTLAPLATRK